MRIWFAGWTLLGMSLAFAVPVTDPSTWRTLATTHPGNFIEQGRTWLDSGRFVTDPGGERELLWWMGHAAINASADAALTEATSRLDSLGVGKHDDLALAYAGFLRADYLLERGDPNGTSVALHAAERLQGSADPQWRALGQFQLCDVYTMAGDIEHAQPLCRDAAASYQTLGDEWNRAQAENNLGVLLSNSGKLGEAVQMYEQARRRYLAVGDHAQAVMVGDNLAHVYLDLGRAREALDLSTASLADEHASGRSSDALLSRANIARALSALGHSEAALAEISTAVAEARDAHKNSILVSLLETQSSLAEAAGELKLALIAERETVQAREAMRAPGLHAEEAELDARYAARENELRIRDLERDNRVKDLELKSAHAEAGRLDDAAWQQRLNLVIIAVIASGLALIVLLLWLLLRAQRRHALVLGEQALLDPLTGVENRRGFFLRMDTLLEQANSIGTPAHALLFIDIDHFKRINDSGGHPFGDMVLTAVVECVRRVLGSRGTMARLGGEEFAVLCPRIGAEGSLHLAESMRAEVAKLCFSRAQEESRVTISIGLALFDAQRSYDADSWMRNADSALYSAKAHGRNRVVASAAVR